MVEKRAVLPIAMGALLLLLATAASARAVWTVIGRTAPVELEQGLFVDLIGVDLYAPDLEVHAIAPELNPITGASGRIRIHSLVGDPDCYFWYEGAVSGMSAKAPKRPCGLGEVVPDYWLTAAGRLASAAVMRCLGARRKLPSTDPMVLEAAADDIEVAKSVLDDLELEVSALVAAGRLGRRRAAALTLQIEGAFDGLVLAGELFASDEARADRGLARSLRRVHRILRALRRANLLVDS